MQEKLWRPLGVVQVIYPSIVVMSFNKVQHRVNFPVVVVRSEKKPCPVPSKTSTLIQCFSDPDFWNFVDHNNRINMAYKIV